ncbi:MAG: hypothetical protein HY747_04965, partial [Elusimicrobia bacterium]|nr:hypothetical protein [Elusimicrobiota bacterium]
DTTILRVLNGWVMEPTITAAYNNHLRLRPDGLAKTALSTGREIVPAIADASNFGGFEFSVLAVAE